jgi:hypothetical protein
MHAAITPAPGDMRSLQPGQDLLPDSDFKRRL